MHHCQGYVTLISYLNIRLNVLSLILSYSLVHIYSFYFYVLCKWQYVEEALTTIMCGGFFLFENVHMVSEPSRTSLHRSPLLQWLSKTPPPPSPFQHHDSHGDHQTLLLQLSPMEEPASSSPWNPRTSRPCGWNSCTSSTVCSCWLSDTKHQALGMEKYWPAPLESFALLPHGGSHGRGCRPLHLMRGLVSTRKYIQSLIKSQRNSAQGWPSIDETWDVIGNRICSGVQSPLWSTPHHWKTSRQHW